MPAFISYYRTMPHSSPPNFASRPSKQISVSHFGQKITAPRFRANFGDAKL
jgi:hypothetical protein